MPPPDGEPGDCVRLFSDGPYLERGATVHPQHLQENQEGRMQCAAHPEVHSQVCPPSRFHFKVKKALFDLALCCYCFCDHVTT